MTEEQSVPSALRAAGKWLLMLLALLVAMELTNRLDGHDTVRALALLAGHLAP